MHVFIYVWSLLSLASSVVCIAMKLKKNAEGCEITIMLRPSLLESPFAQIVGPPPHNVHNFIYMYIPVICFVLIIFMPELCNFCPSNEVTI